MIKKYAYVLHDCEDGEVFCAFTDKKLNAPNVMLLMIEYLASGGCTVYDTKMSDESNWEKITYFTAPMSSF